MSARHKFLIRGQRSPRQNVEVRGEIINFVYLDGGSCSMSLSWSYSLLFHSLQNLQTCLTTLITGSNSSTTARRWNSAVARRGLWLNYLLLLQRNGNHIDHICILYSEHLWTLLHCGSAPCVQTVVGMYSDEGEHFRFHQAQKAGRTARLCISTGFVNLKWPRLWQPTWTCLKIGDPQNHGFSILKWCNLDDLGYPQPFGNLHMVTALNMKRRPKELSKIGTVLKISRFASDFLRYKKVFIHRWDFPAKHPGYPQALGFPPLGCPWSWLMRMLTVDEQMQDTLQRISKSAVAWRKWLLHPDSGCEESEQSHIYRWKVEMDSFPPFCSSCSTLQVYYYASQAPCSEIAFHRGIRASTHRQVWASELRCRRGWSGSRTTSAWWPSSALRFGGLGKWRSPAWSKPTLEQWQIVFKAGVVDQWNHNHDDSMTMTWHALGN